ncbi:bola-like protein-domain-containing protein [Helicostylum pulchrum]|uniref:Bola-like protein n=1 Tax=Helicostylum pulchrum TaxID=562976 RepID=A0ABP9Y7E1_9FUNG|nr:bola-like protein-domain-containing protein [Helicostylum pulchrum]
MLSRVLQPVRQPARFYSSSTNFLNTFMSSNEKGPVQLSIESKITEALNPTILEAVNESHKHAHHEAMKGVTNKETHFKVTVVSDAFQGKSLMQRHRLIYGLLDDELKNQGLHALTLKTKTQAELEK